MQFEWDVDKSDRNVRLRRFDFSFASQVFLGSYLDQPDDRRDYGERRLQAIGVADGIVLTVVYTDRITDDGAVVRRIISARRSNRRERHAFREALDAS